MDKLIKVEGAEVELYFRPPERCAASFKITSLIHTMPVAVQLTTTRPGPYSFSPATVALLLPLSTTVFTLALLPTAAPPLVSPPDSLIVTSALTPTLRRATSAALHRFFSRPALFLFRDASLPIHLVGPHVLRSLFLPPISSLQRDLLLLRVISSCSPDELSAALPLAAAAAGGATAVSALLSAGADPNARRGGAEGKSAISLAVSAGSVKAVEALIESGAADRPFHEAASGNRTDLILLLAESGSAPGWGDLVDGDGRTPVHTAAGEGSLEALRLCLSSGGGDPDRPDSRGWTPLHHAAAGGHLITAELLINSSAFDPRHALTLTGRGKKQRTPLDLAMEEGHTHLYDLLRPGGEVIRSVRHGGQVAEAVRKAGGPGERDQNGWTALHVAAFRGRMEAVMDLVDAGAELEAADGAGYTPLRCAVEAGRAEVALWLVGRGARAGLKGLNKAKGGSFSGFVAAPVWESCAAAVSAAISANEKCRTEL
ncbi:Potassium channel AKT1 [Apostasia shenzhenica]|uniref:Potassium channel AKT1 n=1 Tax=Apostasia shenzhenica TaxID=1088818 RepID=A0A2I0B3B9_9ASPA|nr:Potassium channel AKT1 [Apostasia shenzhenica]